MQYTTNILPFEPMVVYQCAYSVLMSYKKASMLGAFSKNNDYEDNYLPSLLTAYSTRMTANEANTICCLLKVEAQGANKCQLHIIADAFDTKGCEAVTISFISSFLKRFNDNLEHTMT